MARPFRFAVTTGSAHTQDSLVSLARRAEDLGYSTLLVPDRTGLEIAPLTAIAVAAQSTTTLRVGTFVLVNDYRHPALVAKEIATLDVLSGGRVELGMGVGNFPPDFAQLGIPMDSPGTRIARLDEALQVITALFTGQQVDFKGQFYTLEGLKGLPRPLQQPYPPIFIGGAGRRLLELGAKYADILGISVRFTEKGEDPTDAPMSEKIEWVRQAAGERFGDIELNQGAFGIQIKGAPEVGEMRFGPRPVSVSLEEAIEGLQKQRDEFGFSYIHVGQHQLENFAPVVARLAGK